MSASLFETVGEKAEVLIDGLTGEAYIALKMGEYSTLNISVLSFHGARKEGAVWQNLCFEPSKPLNIFC